MTDRDERLRARGPATHAAAADGASKARTDEAHNALVANRTRDVVAAAAGRLRFPRVQGFTISPFVSKLVEGVKASKVAMVASRPASNASLPFQPLAFWCKLKVSQEAEVGYAALC